MAASTTTTPPLSRKRRMVVWGLVLLATILTFVAILTTWVNRQMLDNTAWNQATTQAIEDPQVQASLATYAVNQLYSNVDVAQAIQDRLPPNLKPLAPTLAGALQQPATKSMQLLLQRPRFQQLFIRVSSIAHQKLVNVLENKTGYGISTGNGDVTLNLHEFIVEIGTQLGLSSSTLAKLPDKAGTITLMKSDQLAAAQDGVRAVRVLSVWLLVGVLFLYGLAIYLARGGRRSVLRNCGFALVIVGLLCLLARQLLGNYITNALAQPGYEPTTHRLWLIGTSILGQIGEATILYGAIAALGAIFAGPTAPAVWLRAKLAPTLNDRQELVWAGVGFVFLLLILWGGTHALRTWWGILLLGGLTATGIVALRRQTLQEFPTATTPEGVQVPVPRSEAPTQPAAPPAKPSEAPTQPAAGQRSPAEELARLQELHDSGAITDDEFERAKNGLA